ncbi:MAG: restriction endonuclease [Brachybacterium sp.]|nr:restriction endonuclease [Brachybacterium sp.]
MKSTTEKTPKDLPRYTELILPVLKAVETLGGSGKAREVREEVLATLPGSDDMVAVMYPNKPSSSVLEDRVEWARWTAKNIGTLEQPARGVCSLTAFGRELLRTPLDEAVAKVTELDREKRREYRRRPQNASLEESVESGLDESAEDVPLDADVARFDIADDVSDISWRDTLLTRLHQLTPTGFEEFVLLLLREHGLELTRVGGSGDEGIDGIGRAPISAVLSSRVAVQVKRYSPEGKPIGRETVALFQRDAQTKGAERAILVTLGRFTEPARKAAISATPTVDLIDGNRLAELILDKQLGVQLAPVVNERWFDRFT